MPPPRTRGYALATPLKHLPRDAIPRHVRRPTTCFQGTTRRTTYHQLNIGSASTLLLLPREACMCLRSPHRSTCD